MAYNFTSPFTLSRRDGWVMTFLDLDSLLVAVRACGMTLSTDPVDGEWCAWDREGFLVPDEVVRPETRSGSGFKLWGLRAVSGERVRHAERLGLPIPGTGNSWRKRGRPMLRHPRHLGADRAREAIAWEAREDRLHVKGVVGHSPPNAYDDIVAGDLHHRTWKRSRRTRWRKPALSWKSGDGQAPGLGGPCLHPDA